MPFDLANVDDVIGLPPFSLGRDEKLRLFDRQLSTLTRHHADHCGAYRRILDALHYDPARSHTTDETPLIPARLFKTQRLQSIDDHEVRRVLTSSGTSGSVSRIALDAAAVSRQSRALSAIVSDFIGKTRLPMLVIDSESILRRGQQFPARVAGILGFSLFGRQPTFALDDGFNLDLPTVLAFVERNAGAPVLLFGFTFMVFQSFIRALEQAGRRVDLSNGILIHGGGWKKLADQAISSAAFKARLRGVSGIGRVHNYYGTVEQTGSIFMECEQGRLHCSNLSHVIVRDARLAPVADGVPGIMQLLSLLPHSYPGHSLLTEDQGVVLGDDDCGCGRLGRTFAIHGRIAAAEIRGCSDAYAA